MKEFVERCVITFRWWREDRESLHSSVLQDLEVLAYERIHKMKVEGCTAGELSTELNDVGYRGWFDIAYTDELGCEK